MKKLLLADRSEELTAALARRLAGEFHITVCYDGWEAVRLLDTLKPDVLWLDLHLPLLPGFAPLDEARTRPPVCLVRTVYLTEALVREARARGVRDIFPTPCTVEAIVRRITAYR